MNITTIWADNNKILLISLFLAAMLSILTMASNKGDFAIDNIPIGGQGHEDTLSTPWPPSSCPCGYPGCKCPTDNEIAITLIPTMHITALAPIGEVATPAIPMGATVFATTTAHPPIVFPPTAQPIGPTPGPTLANPTPVLPDDLGSVPRPTN